MLARATMDAILTLHSIDDSASVLSYRASDLEALLDLLGEEEVRVVPLREILEVPRAAAHRLALTFDDGIRSVHRHALPLLARRRLPATLYAVADRVGRTNAWPGQPPTAPAFDLMDWGELREVRDAGFTIGCHGASHRRLEGLSAMEWQAELGGARARLEDELQVAVPDFAYPYGWFDDGAARRVGEVFDTAVTTQLRFLAGDPPHRLPRLDAYYLRRPRRRAPLFGARTRRWLALRGLLRQARGYVRPGTPLS